MPNRIIKESICMSEDIAKLSQGAEILFYRLIVKADDYGAYYGNEKIIKNTCFPLISDDIKLNQVKKWLEELVSANLIYYYQAEDGKPYIQFIKWATHQQIRSKKSKFPVFDSNCNQMISNDSKCSRNPIQSNPIENLESNPNPNICTEQAELAPVPQLPLNDGSLYSITQEKFNQWVNLYPAVNVEQEIRNMCGWLNANKQKRKTKGGIERFIVNWLMKEQNSGKSKTQQTYKPPKPTTDTSRPANYDIERAQRLMDTTVPKLKKKGE